MGLGVKNLSRLRDLGELGLLSAGDSIIELGAQELYCRGGEAQLLDFISYFSSGQEKDPSATLTADMARIADRGFSGELFKKCGFEYHALDIFDGKDITLFDLNLEEPPQKFVGKFDLVTNFGTTEHVLNQYLAFKTMHELAKPGGVMYHELPLGGFHLHGYFNYNPMLFEQLAEANKYEILFYWYSSNGVVKTSASQQMKDHGFPAEGWVDLGIEFVLKKTSDQPFRMPLDTTTSLGLNPTILNGEGNHYGRNSDSVILNSFGSINRKADLGGISGKDLQRELVRRYANRVRKLFGAR
jgi:hypothetical protein